MGMNEVALNLECEMKTHYLVKGRRVVTKSICYKHPVPKNTSASLQNFKDFYIFIYISVYYPGAICQVLRKLKTAGWWEINLHEQVWGNWHKKEKEQNMLSVVL
jgi:hypothetical protein